MRNNLIWQEKDIVCLASPCKHLKEFSQSCADSFVEFDWADRESIEDIIQRVSKFNSKTIVIIDLQGDGQTLSLVRSFSQRIGEYIAAVKDSEKDRAKAEFLNKLNIYFFCDAIDEDNLNELISSSYGCARYKNIQQMTAINFIEQYPLSSFMNSNQIDYESAMVNDGVDINVCILGFGRLGREIFLTSVANNQFLKKSNCVDGVEIKQVKYHMFDSSFDESREIKTYYRYRRECLDKIARNEYAQEDYLTLPQLPALEEYHDIGIDGEEFYGALKGIISNKNDANFVVVAYGSDRDNIKTGRKIFEICKQCGIDNVVIFIKTEGDNSDEIFNQPSVKNIGNVFANGRGIGEILEGDLFDMARLRNFAYHVEYEVSQEGRPLNDDNIDLWKRQTDEKWYVSMSQIERDSSLYSVLSLRSKLNLMGLDCYKISQSPNSGEIESSKALTNDEYMDIYAFGDKPAFYAIPPIDGRRVVDYPLDFKASLRTNFAILEHLRWNSYMIVKGMIPSSKEQILSEKLISGRYTNGKNYKELRHGNLTTFEGLVEFRRLVAERDSKSEISKDVIKYDYQLMDDAHWLLCKNGYAIIKRKK